LEMAPNIESFNSDELQAPAWMNDTFFTEVLAKYFQDPNLKVIGIKTSPASAKGDHYASVMFRASVEYSTQKGKFVKSLIIKTMPEENSIKMDFLGDSHIFTTEILMYTEILPKFESILKDAGETTTFCAKCVYYSLEPRQVMVFEDLVPQGYEVIRRRDATVEELKATLSKLAKWHAVSYKLLKEQPKIFDQLKYDLTTVPNFLEQDILTSALPNFIDMLGRVEGLQKYQKYFEPLRATLIQRWANLIREYRENPKEDSYYVLCHGDYHLKNMMFKGNDCMLLDFQMSYVGSMTNDLIYAIYMLFSPEDRRERRDELIYHYFEVFSKTLSIIGYEGSAPNLVDYRKQISERKYQEIFLLTTFLPGFITMRNGQDPGEFINDANKRFEMYCNEEYQKELEYLLPRLLHLGYFEQK
ncbi:hypothetical protein KR222_005452, partial [Zaprionus bogoriensis]